MSNFTQGKLSIKTLSLWDENARFPDIYFKKTEEELVDYFVSEQGFKIYEFAKEVVNEFDLPQIEKLVVLDLNNRKIVLEGNRRLTVYKLLANPEIASNENVRSRFRELKKRIQINSDFRLECIITEDKDSGLRFVERKHLKREIMKGLIIMLVWVMHEKKNC